MATTYTLISSVTVGSGGAQNMVFTNIPQTYTDLLLRISARNIDSNYGGYVVYRTNINTRFQGKFLSWDNGSASSGTTSEFFVDTSSMTANVFSSEDLYIPNYTSSNNKSLSGDGVIESNSSGNYRFNSLYAYSLSDTAAINQLYVEIGPGFADKFAQYSTAYLYGISNA